MKCTACGEECFESQSPEVVFRDEFSTICENCSIDYFEQDGFVFCFKDEPNDMQFWDQGE